MLASIVALMLAQVAASRDGQEPSLQCETGPLHKNYGGNAWLVYSCSDRKTLVVVSDQGNPASPFYFVIYPKDGHYSISGEGTGSKAASNAALEDLKKISGSDIAAMLEATKAP